MASLAMLRMGARASVRMGARASPLSACAARAPDPEPLSAVLSVPVTPGVKASGGRDASATAAAAQGGHTAPAMADPFTMGRCNVCDKPINSCDICSSGYVVLSATKHINTNPEDELLTAPLAGLIGNRGHLPDEFELRELFPAH